jgi:hypothetical protein
MNAWELEVVGGRKELGMRRRGLRTPLRDLANRLWAISLRREAAGKAGAIRFCRGADSRQSILHRAFLIEGFIIYV